MAQRITSLMKEFPNKPASTLSFLENDDTYVKTVTEKERKTEKSVRFADEESVSESQSEEGSLQTSRDIITWLPSEHLYGDDTFISESHLYGEDTFVSQTQVETAEETGTGTSDGTGTTVQTVPSYGTNTFIDLESEDETRTASEYSYSDSFASSAVFSSQTQIDLSPRREWRDITEIVKDIEELEESEFVTRIDSLPLDEDVQGDMTDITESEDEEMEEAARQDFLVNTIRRLKLQDLQSPRSLAIDSQSSSFSYATPGDKSTEHEQRLKQGFVDKDTAVFCQKMIENCRRREQTHPSPAQLNRLHLKAQKPSPQVLEHYGLNSAIVERLKLENLQHKLEKKSMEIEEEAQKSLAYVRDHQHIEEEHQKQEFLSEMIAAVQNEKMDELIQDHHIKMHPVKWFSEFVNELPKFEDDSWEILYKYKRQIENRKLGEDG